MIILVEFDLNRTVRAYDRMYIGNRIDGRQVYDFLANIDEWGEVIPHNRYVVNLN